ncbi:D-alanyl-D-alanine carboxypeptidase/D-alanyl-D-alanine endopeptidase [Propionicimonas paludicola]|nr:D-alanyl-D-alanine carboxypeptidase/D-alanyl-D-alanine-endopeptidase [Propionicimonas paludicola]
MPSPDALAAALAKVSATSIGTRGMVVLADDDQTLVQRNADQPLTPASTMKVLSTMATVDILGADHRFTTSVVTTKPGALVLVGGGDPLLTDKAGKSDAKPASLQKLADQTVASLRASGITKVSLGYDARLFSGPDFSPNWKSSWKSYESRVSALIVDSGRITSWQAQPNPAQFAAKAFAKRLSAAKITVTSVKPAALATPGTVVASVESAPLATVIAHTLAESDNLAAEIMLRQAAVAKGQPGSFVGAAQTLTGWLKANGLWSGGMVIVDGSGLATKDRVSANVLAKAISLSLRTERLMAVAAGLPVAGQSGTLKHRFDDKSERAGRGRVHAKTGTLRSVASLAGWVTTADGARLIFAFVGNNTAGQNSAYNWLDRSASVLAGCGCR